MVPIQWGLRHSLSTRLIMAFVAVILVTTVAVGIPAYLIVRDELERQAWARVADARRITMVSLETEQARLSTLAILAAQRPSLLRLLQQDDRAALADYLHTFQASLYIDGLAVYDVGGDLLASGGSASPGSVLPDTPGVTFYTSTDPVPVLAMVAGQPIRHDETDVLIGYVTASMVLDDDFACQLADETGFDQSFLLGTIRVATNLEHAPPLAVEMTVVEQAIKTDRPQTMDMTIQGQHYYAALIPLHDHEGAIVALAEAAMPVGELVTAENRALLMLAISALATAAIGLILGGWYARRLAAPLKRLTSAAHRIGQGNLETPVPVPERPVEIATLALALEESRANTCRTLDELSRAKAWSETLIQSITEGVITFDAEGRITFFSQGAERITGRTDDKALGKLFYDVLALSESDSAQLMDSLPASGSKRQMNVTTRGDRPMTLAVTAARLVPPDSDSVQVVLVLRDISDQEAGRHLHSYFLANISHEFRTPLSGLNASIELLLDEADYLSSGEVDELLNSIHLSASGLQALVDNLLGSVDIEAGHFTVHRRPIDLNRVIAGAIRTMQPLLDRRQQTLSLSEPLTMPSINADPNRLTQVLINLLSNASKYSPHENMIDLNLVQTDTMLRVEVLDRGPGIPPGERESLFRRFVRLGAHDTEQYGIGLGLSVVKAIVEGHGGEVGVDERSGGGSIFWFTLPLAGETA